MPTDQLQMGVSPLRAAREWRGLPLAVAARACGLSMSQAEALEDGISGRFDSTDEMLAAAVVYASSLGIGRDEAMALLDRTLQGTRIPSVGEPEQVAADGGSVPAYAIDLKVNGGAGIGPGAMPVSPTPAPLSVEDTGEIPIVDFDDRPHVPEVTFGSDEVARAMQSDPAWRATVQSTAMEFEEWAQAREREGTRRPMRTPAFDPTLDRGGEFLVRLLGRSTAARVLNTRDRALHWVAEITSDLREQLRRSEHATLLVSAIIGLVVIALLVAIASAIGGNEPNPPASLDTKDTTAQPAATTPTDAEAQGDTTATTDEAKPDTPATTTAILPRAKLKISVLNAGSVKGKAAELGDALAAKRYMLGDVGNTQTRYPESLILYPKGLNREAERLSRETGITTLQAVPEGALKSNAITVVVV